MQERACTHTPELALPRYVVDRSPCLRGSFTIVNGLRLHARVSRTPPARGAPTVVLVHGLGVSSAYLVPTAERLAQEFRNFDFLSPWEGTAYVLPGDEKAGKPG